MAIQVTGNRWMGSVAQSATAILAITSVQRSRAVNGDAGEGTGRPVGCSRNSRIKSASARIVAGNAKAGKLATKIPRRKTRWK